MALIYVCPTKNSFAFFTKTHVVDTQKNRLNETVLLSTKTYDKEIFTSLHLKHIVYLNLWFMLVFILLVVFL